VGRSRILRRAYRNTYEIALTAYGLIAANESLVQELRDDGEDLLKPDFDVRSVPHGDYPVLKECADVEQELGFVSGEIQDLLQAGYQPNEILVLGRRTAQITTCLRTLRAYGLPVMPLREDNGGQDQNIAVGTLHAAKGLECRAVFILHLDSLFQLNGTLDPGEVGHHEADELRLLYVGMTRARERLYLSFRDQLPDPLRPLEHFLAAAARQDVTAR
jgi:superfamily I DNA/RNA helicase